MGDKTSNIKRLLAAALATLTLSVLAVAQSGAGRQPERAQEPELDSLFFTVERTSDLSTFFKAVKASGLTDTLKGAGPFTVFAPTDEAFAKLPAETLEELFRPQNKERLRDILIAHIFAVGATSGEMSKLNGAVTLKRNALPVETNGGVRVGGAAVTQADIMATNGVLHLVDTVLMPPGGN
jgi:uncharacterized surface protein with fasciclin (FAS1) repeats